MSTTAVFPKCRKCGLDISGSAIHFPGDRLMYHFECAPTNIPGFAPPAEPALVERLDETEVAEIFKLLRAELDRLQRELAECRSSLATQCGKTMVALAERDGARREEQIGEAMIDAIDAERVKERAALAERTSELAEARAANSTRPEYDLRCEECGRAHILDTVLPSEIWNQIAEPGNLLCMICIDRRLAAKGLKAEAEFYFVGKALLSKLYHDEATPAERTAEVGRLKPKPGETNRQLAHRVRTALANRKPKP